MSDNAALVLFGTLEVLKLLLLSPVGIIGLALLVWWMMTFDSGT